MRVLVVNTGSSSLKLSLLGPAGETLAATTVEDWAGAGDIAPLRRFLDRCRGAAEGAAGVDAAGVDAAGVDGAGVDAVGHRIVHGGARFRSAARLAPDVRAALEELTALAPLHQPRALAGVDAVAHALPDVPAVGCFDTAFHATLPPAAATYALPAAWRERWGLRRYGFHGLSHAYAARRAAELTGRRLDQLRVVTCHLGAGASLCAVAGGRSVDTTMGFTPLEGLVMATRSGSVDPGLLLWLQQHAGLSVAELSDGLEHASGLAGLAGGSGAMTDVQAAAAAGEEPARAALAVYTHRLRREIAAMAAALDGVDVLVFTGGIGEHAAPVRAAVAAGLGFLGVAVHPQRNAAGRTGQHDVDISTADAPVRTLVIAAREDLEIARQVRHLLSQDEPGGEPAGERCGEPGERLGGPMG